MSLKARIDADHNTLTDMVNVVGDAKREIQQHLSEQDKEFSEFKQEARERFDQQDKGVQ